MIVARRRRRVKGRQGRQGVRLRRTRTLEATKAAVRLSCGSGRAATARRIARPCRRVPHRPRNPPAPCLSGERPSWRSVPGHSADWWCDPGCGWDGSGKGAAAAFAGHCGRCRGAARALSPAETKPPTGSRPWRVTIPSASALRAVRPHPQHRWTAGSGSRAARSRTARARGAPPARPRSSASRRRALR